MKHDSFPTWGGGSGICIRLGLAAGLPCLVISEGCHMLSLLNQNCHGSAHRDVLGPSFHQQLGDNAIILQAQVTQCLGAPY